MDDGSRVAVVRGRTPIADGPVAILDACESALCKVRDQVGNAVRDAIGITESNLSLLKSGKVRGIRFSTLEAICKFLECQPGDLLEYVPNKN